MSIENEDRKRGQGVVKAYNIRAEVESSWRLKQFIEWMYAMILPQTKKNVILRPALPLMSAITSDDMP